MIRKHIWIIILCYNLSCRSPDGRILSVASTDGFITFITFSEGELGEPYTKQVVELQSRADITRREQERAAERERKKKAKDEARKQGASGKTEETVDSEKVRLCTK